MVRRSTTRTVAIQLLLAMTLAAIPLLGSITPHPSQVLQPSVATALELPHVPGEIFVKFQNNLSEEERKQALLGVDAREQRSFAEINAKLAATDPEDLEYVLSELNLDPRVEYAEPNYLLSLDQDEQSIALPDDEEFGLQWSMRNDGQAVNGQPGKPDADVDAPEAWTVTTGRPDVTVAVIDSGVDFSHPDLGGSNLVNSRMWLNPGETCAGCATDRIDNDGNGLVDDWRGWDWANEDDNPFDDNGHGTHVSGIIGAIGDNGIGTAGIAWDVQIMALKSFGAGGGGDTALSVEAVLYATEKGADVINASWGSFQPSLALRDAIEFSGDQGVLFVAAAGNDSVNTDLAGQFPSALDLTSIISVAATNNQDELADFSNYGVRTVDLGAPGENIWSTWQTGEVGIHYRYASGTSMATPHVTGTAALILSHYPEATPIGVKNLLFNSVDPLPALEGQVETGGRLNAYNAVSCQAEPQAWIDRPVPGFAAVPGESVELRVFGTLCAGEDGVTVAAHAGDQQIDLLAQGGGLYTGTFTPDEAGPIDLTAEVQAGELIDTHTVTGEAVLNYQFANDQFDWLDATAGQQITFEEKNGQTSVELPFAFSFYDRPFSEILIGENGLIGFGETRVTQRLNQDIPDILAPNGYIGPFWDDLDLEEGGELWYATVGAAPNRRFVVSWIDVAHAAQRSGASFETGPVDGITFQVVLEEGTNDILFQYLDADFNTAALDYGNQATIGLEHFTGTIGKRFSYEEPLLRDYEGTRSIRFTLRSSDQPEITTLAIDNAEVGESYIQQLSAAGGTPPYSWSLADGVLPSAMTLDPLTGILAGTPFEVGDYAITMQATDSEGRIAQQFLGLSVITGYDLSDVPFDWINASAGGERLPFDGDDEALDVELPFGFKYYDQMFNSLRVSSNGYLVFGEDRATTFTNTELPDVHEPNGVVAALWDDLSARDGNIWTKVVGHAPNRQFIIEWQDIPRFSNHGAGTFEISLDEGTNDITFQYLSLDFQDEEYNFGGSATIGIESGDGSVGTQFSMDKPLPERYIGGTDAIRFSSGNPARPEINTESLVEGAVQTPYHALLSAKGGIPPLRWSVAEGELPPGLALDAESGVISGIPTDIGNFPFTAQARDSSLDPQTISGEFTIQILPGYQIDTAGFNWIDSRADGERLSFPGDDSESIVSLPFAFEYYGQAFESVKVSTNGFLVFGDSEARRLANVSIPEAGLPNGIVAVLWDDLSPDTGQGVWVRTTGEPGSRKVAISWIDAPRFRDIGSATFQVILSESSNSITMQYRDVVFDDERYDYGASATIGVESLSGILGTQFSFNEPSLAAYEGQQAIVFTPLKE